MKKIITLIALSLLIISCGKSKEELSVKNHVETIGGVKTDLSFELIKAKDLPPYTNKDSINVLDKLISIEAERLKTKSEISLRKRLSDVGVAQVKLKYAKTNELKKAYSETIESYNNIIKLDSATIKDVNNRVYKGLSKPINKMLESKLNLSKDSGKVIYTKKEVTYKIKNPLLNNVEQTITEIFYFNSDLSKVVRSENKK